MLPMKKIFTIRNFAMVLYFNGLLWFVFSIWMFLSDRSNYFQGINLYDVIASLMFFDFLMFSALAILVFKKQKWSFYITGVWLLLNFLLTFTDQFGFIDLLALLLNVTAIVYCIVLRDQLIPKIDLRAEILKNRFWGKHTNK